MPFLRSTHTLPLLVTSASLILVITGLLALLSVTTSPSTFSSSSTDSSSNPSSDSTAGLPHASSLTSSSTEFTSSLSSTSSNSSPSSSPLTSSSSSVSSSSPSASSSSSPTMSTTSSSSDCPVNWHRFMNKCYTFNFTAVYSKDAKSYCESLNSTMISIHSPEENEFLRRLIFIHYESHLWIWLSRARNYNSTSGYTWLDGSSFGYTNWLNPQSIGCSVCCEISLTNSGHWFGSNCNSWSFASGCQKILPSSLLYADEPMDERHLKGNFYLSQFETKKSSDSSTSNTIVSIDQIDPNVTELIEWLSYEVEGLRSNLNNLEASSESLKNSQIDANVRETYLLILLSFTVTLLVLIVLGLAITYYKLNLSLKRVTNAASPFACDASSIS